MSEVSPNGARRIYRILCNLAASDGSIDPSEREALSAFARDYGVSPKDCGTLEVEGIQGKELRVGKKPAEREALIRHMIELAAADGVLAPQEQRRILKLGQAVGLAAAELEQRLSARFAPAPTTTAPTASPPPPPPRSTAGARPALEGRFPGVRTAKRLEHDGFELRLVESTSDTKEYACHQGGSDRETTAVNGYLLEGPGGQWALFRVRRVYLASDRFDKETVTLTGELHSGETFPLGESFDYEKYNHAQDYDRRSPLAPLSGPLGAWGARYDEARLAGLVNWLMTFPLG